MPSSLKLCAVFIAVFFIINLMFTSIIFLTGRFSMSPGSVVFSVLFWAAAVVAAGLLYRRVLGSYGVLAFAGMVIGLSRKQARS